jgi:hypothetical protein
MKLKNCEICQDVKMSYMKVVNILLDTMFRNRSISQEKS